MIEAALSTLFSMLAGVCLVVLYELFLRPLIFDRDRRKR